MAIVPLQIKMVCGIGKTNGYELDQRQIRALLSTLGVSLTSQCPGGSAKETQARSLPQIQRRAGNPDANQIMTLIRGGQV